MDWGKKEFMENEMMYQRTYITTVALCYHFVWRKNKMEEKSVKNMTWIGFLGVMVGVGIINMNFLGESIGFELGWLSFSLGTVFGGQRYPTLVRILSYLGY